MKNKKNKIIFVLPGRGIYPVGGFRIVYEYANHLSTLGMNVTLAHIACLYKSHSVIKGVLRYFYCLLYYPFSIKWFQLNMRVRNSWFFTLNSIFFPEGDFIVATSWETAEHVSSMKITGKKIYLIQGNETQFQFVLNHQLQERVIKTWSSDMTKIVVSSWLESLLRKIGQPCYKIFNGLDFSEFNLSVPIESRSPTTIMMLYHKSLGKGCSQSFAALRQLKKDYPSLIINVFGVPLRPAYLEEWFIYYQKPSRVLLKKLYNESAIFLSASHSEGWGLPIAEAMQCGCSIITSDIPGVMDFAADNSIKFPVGDILAMVLGLRKLIEDDFLRIQNARLGNQSIKKFTWDKSVQKFIEVLNKIC